VIVYDEKNEKKACRKTNAIVDEKTEKAMK
jgi:hypothetical protein